MVIPLFIYSFILVASSFGNYTKRCYKHPYVHFCEDMFFSQLDKYLGVPMLDHIVRLCLGLQQTGKLSSIMSLICSVFVVLIEF